jgi:hypothetical protein
LLASHRAKIGVGSWFIIVKEDPPKTRRFGTLTKSTKIGISAFVRSTRRHAAVISALDVRQDKNFGSHHGSAQPPDHLVDGGYPKGKRINQGWQ